MLSGGGGHLLDHDGMWTREALAIEWKKQIDPEFMAFDIQGGVDGLSLSAPGTSSRANLTELSVQTSALFHDPHGFWGGWVGVAYAVPVQASGHDPTTNVAIDPQPRLDFHIGTVLSLVPKWDLFVDFCGDRSRRREEPGHGVADPGRRLRSEAGDVRRHPPRTRTPRMTTRPCELVSSEPGVNPDPG